MLYVLRRKQGIYTPVEVADMNKYSMSSDNRSSEEQ